MHRQEQVIEQYRDPSNLQARIQLHEQFSTNKYSLLLWAFDQFELPASSRILELGCGTGKLWRANLHRIPESWSLILSDFSAGMIRQAGKNLAGHRKEFSFARFDTQNIPFEDEQFDAVVANFMLYHLPDLDQGLSEIRRVLKPNGKLYAATNGQNHMKELDDLTAGYVPHVPVGEVVSTFTLESGRSPLKHFFTSVELRRREDGLRVTEVSPLVAYSLSRIGIFAERSQIDHEKEKAFRKHIETQMQAQGGAIRITKDSGLFLATKRAAGMSTR